MQIMEAFCKKKGVDKANTRFIFDGQRINGQQTPNDLDMEVNLDETICIFVCALAWIAWYSFAFVCPFRFASIKTAMKVVFLTTLLLFKDDQQFAVSPLSIP